jgi:hypothetical protein
MSIQSEKASGDLNSGTFKYDDPRTGNLIGVLSVFLLIIVASLYTIDTGRSDQRNLLTKWDCGICFLLFAINFSLKLGTYRVASPSSAQDRFDHMETDEKVYQVTPPHLSTLDLWPRQ